MQSTTSTEHPQHTQMEDLKVSMEHTKHTHVEHTEPTQPTLTEPTQHTHVEHTGHTQPTLTEPKKIFYNPNVSLTTALDDEERAHLEKLEVPASSYDYVNFWEDLHSKWDQAYPYLLQGIPECIQLIQGLLPANINQYVEFEYSYGTINQQPISRARGLIEIYISPKRLRSNIPVMKALYAGYLKYTTKTPIDNLFVSCYRGYHESNPLIEDLDFTDFKVNYLDFGCQISPCILNTESASRPGLNLVIKVKQPTADRILKKETIQFKKDDDTTSRSVWMPTCIAPDAFLLNIIGEANLLNYIGYIEYLHEDDVTKLDEQSETPAEFYELYDIKKHIDFLLTSYSNKKCAYCQHSTLQCDLKKCSACSTTYYCSRICQVSDWKMHKTMCSKLE